MTFQWERERPSRISSPSLVEPDHRAPNLSVTNRLENKSKSFVSRPPRHGPLLPAAPTNFSTASTTDVANESFVSPSVSIQQHSNSDGSDDDSQADDRLLFVAPQNLQGDMRGFNKALSVSSPPPSRLNSSNVTFFDLLTLTCFNFPYGLICGTMGLWILPAEAQRLYPSTQSFTLGLSLVIVGMSQLVCPITGKISDLHISNTTFGKRQPYIVWGGVGAVLSTVGMWMASYTYQGALYYLFLFTGMVCLNVVFSVQCGLVPDIVDEDLQGRSSGLVAVHTLAGSGMGFILVIVTSKADFHLVYPLYIFLVSTCCLIASLIAIRLESRLNKGYIPVTAVEIMTAAAGGQCNNNQTSSVNDNVISRPNNRDHHNNIIPIQGSSDDQCPVVITDSNPIAMMISSTTTTSSASSLVEMIQPNIIPSSSSSSSAFPYDETQQSHRDHLTQQYFVDQSSSSSSNVSSLTSSPHPHSPTAHLYHPSSLSNNNNNNNNSLESNNSDVTSTATRKASQTVSLEQIEEMDKQVERGISQDRRRMFSSSSGSSSGGGLHNTSRHSNSSIALISNYNQNSNTTNSYVKNNNNNDNVIINNSKDNNNNNNNNNNYSNRVMINVRGDRKEVRSVVPFEQSSTTTTTTTTSTSDCSESERDRLNNNKSSSLERERRHNHLNNNSNRNYRNTNDSNSLRKIRFKDVVEAFTIDTTKSYDFFWVFVGRTLYYIGVSVQAFILYFLRDVVGTVSDADRRFEIGCLALLAQGTAACVAYPVGKFTDQPTVGKKPLIYLACFCMSVVYLGFMICPIFGSHAFMFVLLTSIMYGGGNGCFLAVDYSLALATLPNKENTTQALGIWGVSAFIGSAIGPLLWGGLIEIFGRDELTGNYDYYGYVAMLVGGIIATISAGAVIKLVKHTN